MDAAELPRGPSGPHLLEELLPQANHTPQTLVVRAGAAAEGERALHSVSKAWFLIELLLHVHLKAAIGKAVVGSRGRRSDAPIKRKGSPKALSADSAVFTHPWGVAMLRCNRRARETPCGSQVD